MKSICLTQKQMEVLFDVKHATVSEHIKTYFYFRRIKWDFCRFFRQKFKWKEQKRLRENQESLNYY